MKKITSVILFSITGLSLAFSNDSVVSIIKESKVEDIRTIGSELCQLFLNKDKSYTHQLKDYFFGFEPEEKVAMDLRNLIKRNSSVVDLIFSGKASDDKIIRELQLGCFDYLSEAILSLCHASREKLISFNENFFSTATIYCIDLSNNQTIQGSLADTDFNLMPCTNEQLNAYNTRTESQDIEIYFYKLIALLAIEKDLNDAFQQQYSGKCGLLYFDYDETRDL